MAKDHQIKRNDPEVSEARSRARGIHNNAKSEAGADRNKRPAICLPVVMAGLASYVWERMKAAIFGRRNQKRLPVLAVQEGEAIE